MKTCPKCGQPFEKYCLPCKRKYELDRYYQRKHDAQIETPLFDSPRVQSLKKFYDSLGIIIFPNGNSCKVARMEAGQADRFLRSRGYSIVNALEAEQYYDETHGINCD